MKFARRLWRERIPCSRALALAVSIGWIGLMGTAVACQSTPDSTTGVSGPPVSLGAWTSAFLEPGLVIADEIRIEGPPALRIHLGLPQNTAELKSTTTATDNGLLHVFMLQNPKGAPIRAQIDRWQVVATQRLRVLERPFDVNVKIVARGNAAWIPSIPTAADRERRGAELVIVRELDR